MNSNNLENELNSLGQFELVAVDAMRGMANFTAQFVDQ